MEAIRYEQLQEQLFYEKMDNGLEVYILPKNGFNKTFATFTTNYGSIDNEFVPIGKKDYMKVPDGIAHFLEHKLFEKEDGDVFQQFSEQGASANAFTSFTRTAYLFSCTSNLEQNLLTLIDFVQDPYFSDKTVEKEKGIIGQEITMYDDNPDWRLYFGLIDSMYKNHPVKIDIAGTIESISHITKDLLYECYNTFYHPSNMLLFIVGPVDPEKIMDLVRDNQRKKTFPPKQEIQRKYPDEITEANEKKKSMKMNVQTPKCLVGIKALPNEGKSGEDLLKKELSVHVLLDLLFGKSSSNYEKLYNEGLIDDSFSYDFTKEKDFGFVMVGGDTKDPDRLEEVLKGMLLEAKGKDAFSDEEVDRVIKKKIGAFLRAMNSPEYIANQFTRYAFNDMSFFEIVPTLEKITVKDIENAANDLISEERFSTFQILPK